MFLFETFKALLYGKRISCDVMLRGSVSYLFGSPQNNVCEDIGVLANKRAVGWGGDKDWTDTLGASTAGVSGIYLALSSWLCRSGR